MQGELYTVSEKPRDEDAAYIISYYAERCKTVLGLQREEWIRGTYDCVIFDGSFENFDMSLVSQTMIVLNMTHYFYHHILSPFLNSHPEWNISRKWIRLKHIVLEKEDLR